MATAKHQAAWRKKNPHYGLWLALAWQLGRDGEKGHLTSAHVKQFWKETPHICDRCAKPVEFEYGGGPTTRKRQPRVVKRDVFGLWAVDNLRILCAPCFFREERGE